MSPLDTTDPAVRAAGPIEVPKRREVRLAAALEVRVLGMDANGKVFHLPATTLNISPSGASITGLAAKLNEGEIVGVQSSGMKSRFKVVWVRPNPDGTFQAGLHCMEKGATPWRDHLQDPGIDAGDDGRYECHGTAALTVHSSRAAVRGMVRDLSQTGCYLRTEDVVAEGEVLSGKFFFPGIQFDGVAEVRNPVPGVGMALRWTDLGGKGQEKLTYILTTLAVVDSESELCTAKAKLRLFEVSQAITQLRDRLDSGKLLVRPQVARDLDEALDRLTAAMRTLQSS